MPERIGLVVAKSQYGIKVDDPDGDWWNWSRPDYRETPFQSEEVKKGDTVKIDYAEADSGKVYISKLAIITASKDVTPEKRLEQREDSGLPAKDQHIGRQTALYAAVHLLRQDGSTPTVKAILEYARGFAGWLNQESE